MNINIDRVRTLEGELCRIRNVNHASVHLDPSGEIEQIDLISDTKRPPRPIVRDAEAILRRHELRLDHRKIGVVQLETPPSASARPSAPEPELKGPRSVEVRRSERIRLLAVHSTEADGSFVAEVELSLGVFEGSPGRAEGPARDPEGYVNVVARAAVEAVHNLLKPGVEIQFRAAQVSDLAGVRTITVLLVFGRGRDARRLAGVCVDCGSLYETTVYACLDALNRSLGRVEFRDLMVQDEEATPEQLSWRAASA